MRWKPCHYVDLGCGATRGSCKLSIPLNALVRGECNHPKTVKYASGGEFVSKRAGVAVIRGSAASGPAARETSAPVGGCVRRVRLGPSAALRSPAPTGCPAKLSVARVELDSMRHASQARQRIADGAERPERGGTHSPSPVST